MKVDVKIDWNINELKKGVRLNANKLKAYGVILGTLSVGYLLGRRNKRIIVIHK